jgi:hypothetical protein
VERDPHRANPVSFDLRRDMGIWAILALVHTGIGLDGICAEVLGSPSSTSITASATTSSASATTPA